MLIEPLHDKCKEGERIIEILLAYFRCISPGNGFLPQTT